MPEPEQPDPIAAMDQALASLGDMARSIATYHKGLVNAGMDYDHAMVLTLTLQGDLLSLAVEQAQAEQRDDEQD